MSAAAQAIPRRAHMIHAQSRLHPQVALKQSAAVQATPGACVRATETALQLSVRTQQQQPYKPARSGCGPI